MTPACGRSGLLSTFCYTIEDGMLREFRQGTVSFCNCKEGDGSNCQEGWVLRN